MYKKNIKYKFVEASITYITTTLLGDRRIETQSDFLPQFGYVVRPQKAGLQT